MIRSLCAAAALLAAPAAQAASLTPYLIGDGNGFFACGAQAAADPQPNSNPADGNVLAADWRPPGGGVVYVTGVYLFVYQYGTQQFAGGTYAAAGNDTSVMGLVQGKSYGGTLADVHHLEPAAPYVVEITADGRPLYDAYSASERRSFEPDSVAVDEIKVWTHCTAPAQASVFVSIETRNNP